MEDDTRPDPDETALSASVHATVAFTIGAALVSALSIATLVFETPYV